MFGDWRGIHEKEKDINFLTFPTKMEDEASVLAFLCHLIRIQPLLPSDEDADSLDKPSLVGNVNANIVGYEDAKATSK